MSAGGIIRRDALPRPSVRLPITMRGTEPIFDYLIATAERTFQIQDAQLEELKKIRELLQQLVDLMPKVPL